MIHDKVSLYGNFAFNKAKKFNTSKVKTHKILKHNFYIYVLIIYLKGKS
jgi:hypothetical protein